MTELIAELSFYRYSNDFSVYFNYSNENKDTFCHFDTNYYDDVKYWKRFISDLAHLDHPVLKDFCPMCQKSLNFFDDDYTEHIFVRSANHYYCPITHKNFSEKEIIKKPTVNPYLRLEFNVETEAFKPLIEFAKQWNIPYKIGD